MGHPPATARSQKHPPFPIPGKNGAPKIVESRSNTKPKLSQTKLARTKWDSAWTIGIRRWFSFWLGGPATAPLLLLWIAGLAPCAEPRCGSVRRAEGAVRLYGCRTD